MNRDYVIQKIEPIHTFGCYPYYLFSQSVFDVLMNITRKIQIQVKAHIKE